VFLAVSHSVGFFTVETDFYGSYAIQAQRLLDGETYTYRHNPPGYTILIALLSRVTGSLFSASKLLSAIATALFVWTCYDLLKRLFSTRVALASSALVALMLLQYSYLAASDVPGALLVLVPLWLILSVRSVGRGRWLVAGLCAGLAYLVRANSIFVMGALFAVAVFPTDSREDRKRRILNVGILAAGFMVVVSPWLLANLRLNGSPFASTSHLQVAAHFFHPSGDAMGAAMWELAPQFGSMLDVLAYDPARLIRSYISGLWVNAAKLFQSSLLFPGYLFAGAGLLLYLTGLGRRTAAFLLWCLLGYLLLALVGFHLRYYFFLYPMLALWTVLPFFALERVQPREDSGGGAGELRVWLGRAALVLLVGLSAIRTYRDIRLDLASEPRHVLSAASALAGRSNPGDIIISRKPHIGFHAGLRSVFPTGRTVEEFRDAADKAGAAYLVYSDYEARLWPPLSDFRDPEAVAPYGFRPIYRHRPTNTIVYQIDR
jgi:4-amino-4-deoxy-L-arabinose transferase-like glycosyltransferase